jgi:hypothetical protein
MRYCVMPNYSTTPGKLKLKGRETRNWRGAALAHHLKTSRYSWQGADLSRHRVKQAAPGNGLAHRSSIARIGVTKSLDRVRFGSSITLGNSREPPV